MLRFLNRTFAEWTEQMVGAFTLALILLLGFIDHVTGYEISFSIFYLLPVSIAVWFGTRLMGYIASAASAVVWAIVEHVSALPYSQAWILYWNSAVRLAFFIVVAWLLAELRTHLRRHQHLATTDNLTGLLNRTGFVERAGPVMAAAARYEHPTTIGFADLNGFKQINDRLGHTTGDEVLQAVGTLLSRACRSSDIVARYGGDEFVVLLPETNLSGAKRFFSKLQKLSGNALRERGWTGTSLSIGAIVFEKGPPDLIEALRVADGLMYRAKGSGEDNAGRVIVETAVTKRRRMK